MFGKNSVCPNCSSSDLMFNKKKNVWVCEDCNYSFTASDKVIKKRVFISYGRDEYAELAERIHNDLKLRGHSVWFDNERLKEGQDWEQYIEDGLNWVSQDKNNGIILFLLTPHSTRRPDGYCLNEIAKAISKGLDIIPIMVVSCEPPLSICRIQWLDMQECFPLGTEKGIYENRFDRLILALEEGKLEFEGIQNRLINVLRPIEFSSDVLKYLQDFTGRHWIIAEIDRWLSAEQKSRIFWIIGYPGVGKTAISAWLRDNRREISAYHFCNSLSKEKSDPAKLVASLAYQISTQLPDFQEKLSYLNLEWIISEYEDSATLLDILIIQPLLSIPKPDRPITVLIDGLDETSKAGKNELASFIASEFDKTPDWFRLLITSRPDPEVLAPLQKFDPFILDTTSSHNLNDIRKYLIKKLSGIEADYSKVTILIEKIIAKCEGNFLYAVKACENIEMGSLSINNIDDFPRGLGGVYDHFFSRQFPDINYYKSNIRPLLGIIVASYEPLDVQLIQLILRLDEETINDIFLSLGSLFVVINKKVFPSHRSIVEWITNKDRAYHYYVSPKNGQKKLADATVEFLKSPLNESDYIYNYGPYHVAREGLWGEFLNLTELEGFEKGCRNFIKESLRLDQPLKELLQRIVEYAIKNHDKRILRLLLSEIESCIALGYKEGAVLFLDLIYPLCDENKDMIHKNYMEAWIQYLQGELKWAVHEFERLSHQDTGKLSQKITFIQANALRESGDYTRSKEMYRLLCNDPTVIKNEERILYAQQYADILYVQGQHHSAIEILKNFEKEDAQNKYPLAMAEAFRVQGHIYRMNERLLVAERFYSSAHALFSKSGSLSGQARIETNYAETYATITPEKAIAHGFRAISMNNSLSFPVEVGKAQNALGLAYLVSGDLDLSLKYFDNALTTLRKCGYQSGIGMVLSNRLLFYLLLKDFDSANKEFVSIVSLFQALKSYPFLIYRSALIFSSVEQNNSYSQEIKHLYSDKIDWVQGLEQYEKKLAENLKWFYK